MLNIFSKDKQLRDFAMPDTRKNVNLFSIFCKICFWQKIRVWDLLNPHRKLKLLCDKIIEWEPITAAACNLQPISYGCYINDLHENIYI